MAASTNLDLRRDNGSALTSLLRRAISYESAGAVIPIDLLLFGVVGSIIVIDTGFLALFLPAASSIRHGGFFWVFSGTTARLDTLMGTVAIPAMICGAALLGLDVFLAQVRTSWRWRFAVIVQATAGGIGGIACTLFVALLILNLAIWIVAVTWALALFVGIVVMLSRD